MATSYSAKGEAQLFYDEQVRIVRGLVRQELKNVEVRVQDKALVKFSNEFNAHLVNGELVETDITVEEIDEMIKEVVDNIIS